MALIDKSYKKWQGRFKPIAQRVVEIERREQLWKGLDRMMEMQRSHQANQLARERMDLERADQASLQKYREASLEQDKARAGTAAEQWQKEFDQRAGIAEREAGWRREDQAQNRADRESDVEWRREVQRWQQTESEADRAHREKEEGWRREDQKFRQEEAAKDSEVRSTALETERLRLDEAKRKKSIDEREDAAQQAAIKNARTLAKSPQIAAALQEAGLNPDNMTDEQLAAAVEQIADASIRQAIGAGKQSADPEEKKKARHAEFRYDTMPKVIAAESEAAEIDTTIEGKADDEIVMIDGRQMTALQARVHSARLKMEANELRGVMSSEGFEQANDPYHAERGAARKSTIGKLAGRRAEGATPEEIEREIGDANRKMELGISTADLDEYDRAGAEARAEHAMEQERLQTQRIESGNVRLDEMRAMPPEQKAKLAAAWGVKPETLAEFERDPAGFIQQARLSGAAHSVPASMGGTSSRATRQRMEERLKLYQQLQARGIVDDFLRGAAKELDQQANTASRFAMESAGYPPGQMPGG